MSSKELKKGKTYKRAGALNRMVEASTDALKINCYEVMQKLIRNRGGSEQDFRDVFGGNEVISHRIDRDALGEDWINSHPNARSILTDEEFDILVELFKKRPSRVVRRSTFTKLEIPKVESLVPYLIDLTPLENVGVGRCPVIFEDPVKEFNRVTKNGIINPADFEDIKVSDASASKIYEIMFKYEIKEGESIYRHRAIKLRNKHFENDTKEKEAIRLMRVAM